MTLRQRKTQKNVPYIERPTTHFMMATRRLMRSEALSIITSSVRFAASPSYKE